jgi:hydroxymethylbilane synthase
MRNTREAICRFTLHTYTCYPERLLCSDTRLAKLDAPDGPYTAIILAKAGLVRFGASHRITADVGAPTLYYAVSQGALAIEIRSDDSEARRILQSIVHTPTDWICSAERSFLRVLEGGCSVPVGINSAFVPSPDGRPSKLELTGVVTALDGKLHVEHTLSEQISSRDDAEAMGERLARILIETGAQEILDEVATDRAHRINSAVKTKEEVHKIEAAMDAHIQA